MSSPLLLRCEHMKRERKQKKIFCIRSRWPLLESAPDTDRRMAEGAGERAARPNGS